MGVYLLPCHPALKTSDPLSICDGSLNGENVQVWEVIVTVLTRLSPTVPSFLDAVETLPYSLTYGDITITGLAQFLAENGAFMEIMTGVCMLALEMPTLFPTSSLKVLEFGCAESISLTQRQTACLLVHMVFNTLQLAAWSRWWAGFRIWYQSTSPPVKAYLHSLFSYLKRVSSNPISEGAGLHFHRQSVRDMPDWAGSNRLLKQVELVPAEAHLEPQLLPAVLGLGGACQVVFANKHVGFGPSGTQEEQICALSPELCVAVLLCPPLKDNEVLVVQGAMQVGVFKGYGRETEWGGAWQSELCWGERTQVFMDALELDDVTVTASSRPVDLEPYVLQRELTKAYCGFSPLPGHGAYTCISTGHWGCGAFGGNREVKALVQLLAAAEADTHLLFIDIPNSPDSASDFGQRLVQLSNSLVTHGKSVGWLYNRLFQYAQGECARGPCALFDWLLQDLADANGSICS